MNTASVGGHAWIGLGKKQKWGQASWALPAMGTCLHFILRVTGKLLNCVSKLLNSSSGLSGLSFWSRSGEVRNDLQT